MKVLICGSFWHGSLEESYVRGFESIGWRVSRFDWEQHEWGSGVIRKLTTRISPNYIGHKFIDYAVTERPDLIFVVKGKRIRPQTLISFRRVLPQIPIINFNPDSPWERCNSSMELLECIGLYDAHFTWNRALMPQFSQASAIKVSYLPFAYDPVLHSPIATGSLERDFDAVFVGTYTAERDAILGELSAYRVGIWGNGWERARWVSRSWVQGVAVYGEDAVRCMNRGLVSINILRGQNAGSHNMRTFEVPASHQLLLTTDSIEQREILQAGEEMLTYSNISELKERIAWAKNSLEAAEEIRKRGRERICTETYGKRALEIASTLGLVESQ